MSIQFSCFRARRQVLARKSWPALPCSCLSCPTLTPTPTPIPLKCQYGLSAQRHFMYIIIIVIINTFCQAPFTRRRLSSSPGLISTDSRQQQFVEMSRVAFSHSLSHFTFPFSILRASLGSALFSALLCYLCG